MRVAVRLRAALSKLIPTMSLLEKCFSKVIVSFLDGWESWQYSRAWQLRHTSAPTDSKETLQNSRGPQPCTGCCHGHSRGKRVYRQLSREELRAMGTSTSSSTMFILMSSILNLLSGSFDGGLGELQQAGSISAHAERRALAPEGSKWLNDSDQRHSPF